jgi:hypothetical protein
MFTIPIFKLLKTNILDVQRPYLFLDLPMTTGDALYIRILFVASNYRTPRVTTFNGGHSFNCLDMTSLAVW